MKKKHQLPKTLQKNLDDLRKAEEMAVKLDFEDMNVALKPSIKQIEEIQKHMGTPSWRMATHNKISGGIKNQVFNFEFEMEFLLDISQLFRTIDTRQGLVNTTKNSYLSYADDLDNEAIKVAIESLKPKAYGFSDLVKINDWQPINDLMNDKGEFLKIKWPLTMTVTDTKVHFDYVQVFNYLLQNHMLVERNNFMNEVWTQVELFRGKKNFSQSYHWDEGDKIIDVNADFVKINRKLNYW